ncbi:MAG: hypothetical protein R6V58_10265 [Planctomycetota bacterium]
MGRGFLVATSVVLLAAALCEGADERPAGRHVTIEFRGERDTVTGLLIQFEDGEFVLRESGGERRIGIDEVARVVFGRSPGEDVRGVLGLPGPRERDRPRRPGEAKRPLVRVAEALPAADRVLLFRAIRLSDRALARKAERPLRRLLAKEAENGELNRDMRVTLAVLKVVEGDEPAAARILRDLKRDYPKNLKVRMLTVRLLKRMLRPPGRPLRPGRGFRPPAPE